MIINREMFEGKPVIATWRVARRRLHSKINKCTARQIFPRLKPSIFDRNDRIRGADSRRAHGMNLHSSIFFVLMSSIGSTAKSVQLSLVHYEMHTVVEHPDCRGSSNNFSVVCHRKAGKGNLARPQLTNPALPCVREVLQCTTYVCRYVHAMQPV